MEKKSKRNRDRMRWRREEKKNKSEIDGKIFR
jgi:hypothetical protein